MTTNCDAAGPGGEYRLDEHGEPVQAVADALEAATAGMDRLYRLNRRGRPVKSVAHTLEAATAMVEGLAARRRRPDAGLNDDFDLYELGQLVALDRAAAEALDRAAAHLHYVKGYSWGEIARHLGVTRQAARQRWGALGPLEGLERAPLEGLERQ